MQQRKKQPAVTRRAILEAAGAQFSRHGYSGTGIGGIVVAAELTKGALFHHFPDKRSLAAAWIREDLADELRAAWITPLDGLGSLEALGGFCRARCMELRPDDAASVLVALSAEMTVGDAVLAGALGEVMDEWRQAITGLIGRGVAAGWIHRSIQPVVEAAFLLSSLAGLTVVGKTSPEENTRRTFATALEGYLETLRPQ